MELVTPKNLEELVFYCGAGILAIPVCGLIGLAGAAGYSAIKSAGQKIINPNTSYKGLYKVNFDKILKLGSS